MAVSLPYIKQQYTAGCWAACMVSVTGKSCRVLENHTQGWYKQNWAPNRDDAGLPYNSDQFDNFRRYFQFKKSVEPAGKITEEQVLSWLTHGNDYFMLIEQQTGGTSHARMAFDWRNKELIVMDPHPDLGGTTLHMSLGGLNQCVILYWGDY